jgi:hypothetical protein
MGACDIKIGDCRTWAIDSTDPEKPGARQEARRLQGLIDKGIDPRIEKQERLAEQQSKRDEIIRNEKTLFDVWPVYVEEHKARWSPRHLADHMRDAQAGGENVKRGKGKIKPGAPGVIDAFETVRTDPGNH